MVTLDFMESNNYLLVGIGGVLVLAVITFGINLSHPSENHEMTRVMVSLDNKESSTVFVDYKLTSEVFASNGMTINFSENKTGTAPINCTLSCQPSEDDTK